MCSGPDSGHGGEAAVRGEDQGGGGGQGHCQQVQCVHYSTVQYCTVYNVQWAGRVLGVGAAWAPHPHRRAHQPVGDPAHPAGGDRHQLPGRGGNTPAFSPQT